ncbi:MAG: hypothetical protein AAGI52_02960 [Bacteroidota bacterium]
MPRLLLVLALLAPPLAASQTCGGALTLPLARFETTASGEQEWRAVSTFYFNAAIAAVEGEGSAAPEHAPLDWFLSRDTDYHVTRDSLSSPFSGLVQPPDTMRVWTQCGYVLLRLSITDRWARETMTLDLYDVPAHIPLRPSRPIPFHPGRFALNVREALNPEQRLGFDVDRIVQID